MSIVELTSIEGHVIRPNALRSYTSILNGINRYYGWEQGVIFYDRLNQKADELPDVAQKLWKINNIAVLKQKMSAISSLMTRTRFGADHMVKKSIRNSTRKWEVPVVVPEKPAPDWVTEVLPKLEHLSKENTIRGIIATVFKYGYVFRVGEIFHTKLVDDGSYNYLDLDSNKWLIRIQKNGKTKEFSVDPDFSNEIRAKTNIQKPWLISKPNSEPFSASSRTLPYHGWGLWDNTTLRRSYETWNVKHSGRTAEQIEHWHLILGHSKPVVQDYYMADEDVVGQKEPEPEPEPKPKPKPKPKIKVQIKLRTYSSGP